MEHENEEASSQIGGYSRPDQKTVASVSSTERQNRERRAQDLNQVLKDAKDALRKLSRGEEDLGEPPEYEPIPEYESVVEDERMKWWSRKGKSVLGGGETSALEKTGRWKQAGSAESRDTGGYDPGNSKDSLWQGGVSRQVPAGLRRAAGGGNEEEETAGEAGKDSDNGGSDGDDQEGGDENPLVFDGGELEDAASCPDSTQYEVLLKEEKDKVNTSISLHGEEHDHTLESMELAAWMWLLYGYCVDSERLRRRVLEIRERTLGRENGKTINAMADLAETYCKQYRYEEAEKLQLCVVEFFKKHLGPAHYKTLQRQATLATIWDKLGRHEEGKTLRIELLQKKQGIFWATNHHQEATQELAESYYNLKQYEECESLQWDALKLATQAQYPDYRRTVSALAALSQTSVRLDKHGQARRLISDGLEIQDQMDILQNMANVYFERGLFERSMKLSLEVLDLKLRAAGAEDRSAITYLVSLSDTCAKLGTSRESEQLLKQVVDRVAIIAGEGHSVTVTLLDRRANILNSLGEDAEAEEVLNQVIGLSSWIWGERAVETIEAMKKLAYTWTKLGREEEADRLREHINDLKRESTEGDGSFDLDVLTRDVELMELD